MNKIQKGILLTIISVILNASTFIFTKIILNYTNVETMLIWWFAWGTIIFFLFFMFYKKLKEIFRELSKNKMKLTIFGIISSIGIISWTYGILYGDPTSIAFIFRLESVFVIILGLIILKEKIYSLEWIGIIIAIIGAFIMVYNGGITIDKGTIFILISALFSAISILMVKMYVKGIGTYTITYTRTISVLLFIAAYALVLGKFQFVLNLNVLLLTLLCAFVGAFLGFLLFYKSLKLYEISKAIAIRSSEPFFVAIFSLIFMATIPGLTQIIGGSLIVAGVILLSVAGGKKNGNTKNTKTK
jgi:drug/metabolite transporter (DMT)-like permease